MDSLHFSKKVFLMDNKPIGLYFGHAISPNQFFLGLLLDSYLPPVLAYCINKLFGNIVIKMFPPQRFQDANASLRKGLKKLQEIEVRDFKGFDPKNPKEVFKIDTTQVLGSRLGIFDLSWSSVGTGIEVGLVLSEILNNYGYVGDEEKTPHILILYAQSDVMGTYTSSMARGADIPGYVEVKEYENFEERNNYVLAWVKKTLSDCI